MDMNASRAALFSSLATLAAEHGAAAIFDALAEASEGAADHMAGSAQGRRLADTAEHLRLAQRRAEHDGALVASALDLIADMAAGDEVAQ